jgi:hypothetical protein
MVAAGVYFAMMRGAHRMERERHLQSAALMAEDFVDLARRDQSDGD